MGLTPTEWLTVEELLTPALLARGNDAATALAEDAVGVDNFVSAMRGT